MEKHYLAMIIAKECILGTKLTESVSEFIPKEAYKIFANEVWSVNPDYIKTPIGPTRWLIGC